MSANEEKQEVTDAEPKTEGPWVDLGWVIGFRDRSGWWGLPVAAFEAGWTDFLDRATIFATLEAAMEEVRVQGLAVGHGSEEGPADAVVRLVEMDAHTKRRVVKDWPNADRETGEGESVDPATAMPVRIPELWSVWLPEEARWLSAGGPKGWRKVHDVEKAAVFNNLRRAQRAVAEIEELGAVRYVRVETENRPDFDDGTGELSLVEDKELHTKAPEPQGPFVIRRGREWLRGFGVKWAPSWTDRLYEALRFDRQRVARRIVTIHLDATEGVVVESLGEQGRVLPKGELAVAGRQGLADRIVSAIEALVGALEKEVRELGQLVETLAARMPGPGVTKTVDSSWGSDTGIDGDAGTKTTPLFAIMSKGSYLAKLNESGATVWTDQPRVALTFFTREIAAAFAREHIPALRGEIVHLTGTGRTPPPAEEGEAD